MSEESYLHFRETMKFIFRKIKTTAFYLKMSALKNQSQQHRALRKSYDYDLDQFEAQGSPGRNFLRAANRQAFVVMLYHALEKGMALPEPRAGFGEGKARMLVENLEILSNQGVVDSRVRAAISVMQKWLEWNRTQGSIFEDLSLRLAELKRVIRDWPPQEWRVGGVAQITRAELHKKMLSGVEAFMESRHSIRDLAPHPVNFELIRKAVRLAQSSPSLCNRQSCHVHALSKGGVMAAVLEMQGGSNGFSGIVDKVLIVTSELGCFLSVGERNQCWVEGGLFGMMLLLGLHSQGLGACCLNWAKEPEDDHALHKLLNIPNDQRVVMMIAVGHLPETFMITHSPRRVLEEILHYNQA